MLKFGAIKKVRNSLEVGRIWTCNLRVEAAGREPLDDCKLFCTECDFSGAVLQKFGDTDLIEKS